MKMKKIMLGILLLQLASCSSFLTKNKQRAIAQIEHSSVVVQESLQGTHPCEADKNIETQQSATYVYYEKHSLLILADDSISLSTQADCSASQLQLDRFDQVLRMITHEDSGLWFHTLHGQVLRYDGIDLRRIELDFPVSSFEFDGDTIKLYHSDKQGRYCDFDTLSLPLGQRPSTCQYIEAEYNWKEL